MNSNGRQRCHGCRTGTETGSHAGGALWAARTRVRFVRLRHRIGARHFRRCGSRAISQGGCDRCRQEHLPSYEQIDKSTDKAAIHEAKHMLPRVRPPVLAVVPRPNGRKRHIARVVCGVGGLRCASALMRALLFSTRKDQRRVRAAVELVGDAPAPWRVARRDRFPRRVFCVSRRSGSYSATIDRLSASPTDRVRRHR
jgi:hypothetical protein